MVPRSVLVQRTLGLAAAVALAAASLWTWSRNPETRPTAAPVAPATTASTSSSSTSAPPSSSTPPSPSGVGTAPAATSGPGLTTPGIHVVAQADATGGLEVLEQVKLPAPATVLTIALPKAAGSGVAAATPTISAFQAQAGGQVVTDTLASPLPAGGDRLTLPSASTDITLRYRLEGGAERSQPAPVGRALVLLPPVTAARPELAGLPVVVQVAGGNIRNLVCPDLDARDQLCGRQQGSWWSTAAIPLGRSVVVAQMDLPTPGAG